MTLSGEEGKVYTVNTPDQLVSLFPYEYVDSSFASTRRLNSRVLAEVDSYACQKDWLCAKSSALVYLLGRDGVNHPSDRALQCKFHDCTADVAVLPNFQWILLL